MSTVAASSAIFSGLCKGKSVTAVPRRMRWVRWAAAAKTVSGEASRETSGKKWISANHAVSKPTLSPSSICARMS